MKLRDVWPKWRLPLVGVAFSAAAGVVAADFGPVPLEWSLLAAAGAALLAWRWAVVIWIFVGLLFFCAHQERHWQSPAQALSLRLTFSPQPALLTGVVNDLPVLREEGKSRFPLRLTSLVFDGKPITSQALVMVHWKGEPPRYGDEVSIHGYLLNAEKPRNPGEMDYAAYLQRHGIYSEVTMHDAHGGKIIAHNHGSPLFAEALRARAWMQSALRLGLGDAPAISGLIQSMTLGIEDDTPPEMADWFRQTGTMHLFAVSGMNVTLFAAILWMVLRPLGLRRGLAMVIIVPAVIFYAMLTGLSASGVRAAIMAIAVMGAYLSDRKSHPANHLAAAAVVILLWDTEQLFMPGFQLSFGVVLTLMILAVPLQRRLKGMFAPDSFLPHKLYRWRDHLRAHCATWSSALISVTIAAWLGSSPLGWWYFHMVSPVSVAANLIAVPVATFVMALGAASISAATISPWLAAVFNNANWAFAQLVLISVHGFAKLPGSHFYLAFPERHPPGLELTVFDFQDGGAAYLRAGRAQWLIDTGRERDYRWALRAALQTRGVNRLDGLWLTNAESGRLGGAPAAVEEFAPRRICDLPAGSRSPAYRQWRAASGIRELPLARPTRGEVVKLDEQTTIRVLFPPPGWDQRQADDRSVVLQLITPGLKVLLVSDSGFLTETWLLEHERDLRSDILVKGMNAHDFSGLPDFIARVQPRVVISSYDVFAKDHGLSEDWKRMLERQQIALFQQDEAGAVSIRLDSEKWQVSSFLQPHVFTSRAW